MEMLTQWATTVLLWIGFGTLVGLLAKAIMPGRDPEGALTTVIMGILGTIVGAGVLAFVSDDLRVTPLSPMGFVVATAGAFLLLSMHRLMLGRFPGMRLGWRRLGIGGAPRRRVSVVEED
jgi:uncharacterized membrane protein YeaQ/YmgE (transglycosylase-associated protein family)